ncbi:triple tyrosine motif-containing protein [uncultured Winogradskyella sp.]|uniref:helix-turn-helix and ligand-binding sensor domain-containing protein n=1 Tax=uncultured Winogradskyella sp. TaxID=395353 RepID=UPI002607A6A3|nr:triple tyrosine motif-containing protein [uncultured Winogradskyella sp.]
MVKRLLRLIVLFVSVFAFTQEIPPIGIFTPQDYKAEDQNWSITQFKNNFIYAANNAGLLEYNGSSWRLFSSANNDILRSVTAVGDRIYSGGYMDFGYWIKDDYGDFQYTSLSSDRNISVKEDEEFWQIIDLEGYMLFQSLERIYIYNVTEDSFKIIESKVRINKMFKIEDTIYFQKDGVGLFKIENGKEILVFEAGFLNNQELINIYNTTEGLLLHTKFEGFFLLKGGNDVSPWNIGTNAYLRSISAYSSIKLRNGNYIIGTVSNGIIEINSQGKVLLNINQTDGLSNNTVLSIKEDIGGNVWLALDNGINVLNLNSAFKAYKDTLGVLGTVYSSAILGQNLYLGTNQGLFYREQNANDDFKFIKGTKGQVWTLKVIGDQLLCGHDQGTFLISNDKATKIAEEIGTWVIKRVNGAPNLLIQGNYKGLNILEFDNKKWKFRNKIQGFDISSRFIEFISPYEVLVNHEYKGIYKITIDNKYRKVTDYKKVLQKKGVKSGIVTYNNKLLYNSDEGISEYDKHSERFVKDSVLSQLFCCDKFVSGKLINDKNNRLWGFVKNEIIYIEPGVLSDKPVINSVAVPLGLRKTKPGYENVLAINSTNYLIGTTDGYFILDLAKTKHKPNKLFLNAIAYNSRHNETTPVNLTQTIKLSNADNSINFKYSVPKYDEFSNIKYQYRLKGIYDNWSDWSNKSEVTFENLPHGTYKFEARASISGLLSENVLSYEFLIEKPWYLKPLAIASYILLALALGYAVHYFNLRHYKKQKQKLLEHNERELKLEQLENKRRLIQFKNKNLQLDIDNKNRELGTATMNLVKRNELLNNIKESLVKSKSLDDIKHVVRVINSNLNNTSDWKLFEEAFNNVDKDFMKRIKKLHPAITPNDLRLCAYLRLNLSSKEIAPLLNISHKSVEVKRYRLRKKMDLDHDQSLTNYILEI